MRVKSKNLSQYMFLKYSICPIKQAKFVTTSLLNEQLYSPSVETTLTDQNYMREEITSRLNSGNACRRSVQSLLPSCLLPRNVKVKIYKTIILPVVLCGCAIWCHTFSEENRLRVFGNRVLRRIFGPKRDEVTGE
jgi:hypothetical protein